MKFHCRYNRCIYRCPWWIVEYDLIFNVWSKKLNLILISRCSQACPHPLLQRMTGLIVAVFLKTLDAISLTCPYHFKLAILMFICYLQ